MCGRLNITDNEGIRLLLSLLGLSEWGNDTVRYNVAPTASLTTIIRSDVTSAESEDQVPLELQDMTWGLVPVWAKPGQFSSPLINARSETVWEKPSFKNLMRKQRVLVPVTGFYEWHRPQSKTPKSAYYIYPADEKPMFIGGLYQKTKDNRHDLVLLTTAANEPMHAIHHRMPVIIPPEAAQTWLGDDDPAHLAPLLGSASDDYLTFRQVSDFVNNARNEGEACVAAV